ncbi:MAG: 50S ribosomal protein L10 [Candidatus Karelsulcia muelleri]|nr:MAG: 50S ribosomal protein L10 [Candidatus Karelsulcia muelleri]
MIKTKKNKLINLISSYLFKTKSIYLVNLSGLTDNQIFDWRKNCYKHKIKLKFIKNTLLKKSIINSKFEIFNKFLKGPTTLMTSNNVNGPALIINNYKKKFSLKKEYLKAAFIEDILYSGDSQLKTLITLKSKNELLLDIIFYIKFELINLIFNLKKNFNIIIYYLVKKINLVKKIKHEMNKMTDLKKLADKLVNLTVKEVTELSTILKENYGIMAPSSEETKLSLDLESKQEKKTFNVILKSSGQSKLAVVKLIKEVTGKGLKESKDLVDSAPTIIKESLKKEEAESLKNKFENIGAEIEFN